MLIGVDGEVPSSAGVQVRPYGLRLRGLFTGSGGGGPWGPAPGGVLPLEKSAESGWPSPSASSEPSESREGPGLPEDEGDS